VGHGLDEKQNSGFAVLISNGDEGFKEMKIDKQHAGKIFLKKLP
jgi:alpha-amylase